MTTTEWFKPCDTCSNPLACEAILYSVIAEDRVMKLLIGADEESHGTDESLMTQAASFVTTSAREASGKLKEVDCGHDDLAIQQMINRGIEVVG